MEDLRPRTTLFCAVLALAIALSMLLRGRRSVHLLFAAFALEIGLWWGSQSLFDLFRASIWDQLTRVLTVLLPQFAVHLFRAIVPLESGEKPSALTRVSTLLAIPLLAIEFSDYREAPLALGLVYFYVFGLLAAALIALARRGRKSASRAVRDRVRFLVVVGALATTFTLADFLSFLGVLLPPIGAVLSIVFLFVLAESLARPRLADLYEMAGRLLVATALAFSLAGIFYVFVTYVGRFNTIYLNAVLAAIVFLVLFEPLQSQVETRMHQFFFRERYDLETSVADLRARLSHVLEIDEMVETALLGLERSHRTTSCAIYLRDQDGNGFDLAGSFGGPAPERIESLSVRPLLDRLQTTPSLSLDEAAEWRDTTREGTKEGEGPALATAAATFGSLSSSVLLSVRGDEDEIVGILCVADERVRDAFTPEEITLLEAVGAQIGVAIANSRIYIRMKERDRLAALGAMAAGLAHEVKNPLGAIKGAAQLLEESGPQGGPQGDPSSREFVGIILEEVDRLNRVVGSFLDYARPHAGNPIPLDINAAVRRTIQILTSQKAESIELKLDLATAVPRVKIDPEQFRQVLINLVQNAVQAMDGRGRITVSTTVRKMSRAPLGMGAARDSREPRDGKDVRESRDSRRDSRDFGVAGERASGLPREEAEFVEVSVRDLGPGISQKVLKNLFVPFFTTKEQGTGLGLAISQSIVRTAGGTIDVKTVPGAGTTFTILLPAAEDVLGTPLPSPVAPELTANLGRRVEPQRT